MDWQHGCTLHAQLTVPRSCPVILLRCRPCLSVELKANLANNVWGSMVHPSCDLHRLLCVKGAAWKRCDVKAGSFLRRVELRMYEKMVSTVPSGFGMVVSKCWLACTCAMVCYCFHAACAPALDLSKPVQCNPLVTILKCHRKFIVITDNCNNRVGQKKIIF